MVDLPDFGEGEESPLTLSGRVVAGRYRVVRRLGQGGVGKVYEALQIGLDRRAAVKVIRDDRRTETTVKRFLREARAAGRISSPHVVTLFDCGTDEETGELYIAMELLEGEALSRRLARPDLLDMSELVRIGAAIARGLAAAHAAGVLHRDLKPGNVFLCADGQVKVLDFGIAKLHIPDELDGLVVDANDAESLTQADRLLGTPTYMSPETALRRPQGPATDLYALGLMLWEMVVGRQLFRSSSTMKTLIAQVKEPAPRLRDSTERPIPAALDTLVATLLEKRPEDRPADANTVAVELERIAARLDLEHSVSDEDEFAGDATLVELPEESPADPTDVAVVSPPEPEPESPGRHARWADEDTGELAKTTQWTRDGSPPAPIAAPGLGPTFAAPPAPPEAPVDKAPLLIAAAVLGAAALFGVAVVVLGWIVVRLLG